jgi:hypothetical protein
MQIYVHLGKQNAKKIMEQTSLAWNRCIKPEFAVARYTGQ